MQKILEIKKNDFSYELSLYLYTYYIVKTTVYIVFFLHSHYLQVFFFCK